MAHQETFFRLLDLPAELRNRIYEFTFAESITLCARYHDGDDANVTHITSLGDRRAGLPSILKASRQLRSETRLIFYATTTFVFWSDLAVYAAFRELDGPAPACIRHIVLRCNVGELGDDRLSKNELEYFRRDNYAKLLKVLRLCRVGGGAEGDWISEVWAYADKLWPKDGQGDGRSEGKARSSRLRK